MRTVMSVANLVLALNYDDLPSRIQSRITREEFWYVQNKALSGQNYGDCPHCTGREVVVQLSKRFRNDGSDFDKALVDMACMITGLPQKTARDLLAGY